MKRIFPSIAVLMIMALSLVGCVKTLPTVEFSKSYYVLPADGSVDVSLRLSETLLEDKTFSFSVSGSAEKDVEYSLSSDDITIEGGYISANLTVTALENLAEKEIVLTLNPIEGFTLGTNVSTTIAVEAKEKLIYSFATAKAEVLDSYTVKASITGERSGNNYVATADMQIPVIVTVDAADAEAIEYEDCLTLAAGENVAKMQVKALAKAENPVKIAVDESKAPRLIAGDIAEMTLELKELLRISSLEGTWAFDHIYSVDEVMMFFEEEKDDPELLPVHNEGMTLTFAPVETEEGEPAWKMSCANGDFCKLFCEPSIIAHTEPVNMTSDGIKTGTYTSLELNMFIAFETDEVEEALTYFKVKGDRSFGGDKKMGDVVIAMRVNEEGQLILHLKDYDQPPFGFIWWKPEKFDSEMFGFACCFNKVDSEQTPEM